MTAIPLPRRPIRRVPVRRAAVAIASADVALVRLVRRPRTAVFGFVRTALTAAAGRAASAPPRVARSVHTRSARVPALWGGSLAFPALQAAVLVMVTVGPASGLDIPVPHMTLACLAATVAVALVPDPGGLGSVEAALVVTLVAAGGPVTVVVPGFRVSTVRLPLPPGALTLGAPVRLKVI